MFEFLLICLFGVYIAMSQKNVTNENKTLKTGIDWDNIKSIDAPIIPNTKIIDELPSNFIDPFLSSNNQIYVIL